jgi:ATP-dependent Clp protease ATP-binding subunit ClpX
MTERDTTSNETKSSDEILRCSFCNKSQKEVQKLIAGPNVFICDECVGIGVDILAEDELLSREVQATSVEAILAVLNKRVAGQDNAKRRLAAALHHHSLRASQHGGTAAKTNLLLLGPTGVGKSLCARCLAESFEAPFAFVDATRLCGRSSRFSIQQLIASALQSYLEQEASEQRRDWAGGQGGKASMGVIVIDHFDKLAAIPGEVSEGQRIQESLLALLDGADLTMPWRRGKEMSLDTSRSLFIGCGNFSALLAQQSRGDSEISTLDPIDGLTRCGFLPELAARFGTVIQFEPLSEADLVQVMTLGERELLRQYQQRFEADGVKISFTEDAIHTLARETATRSGGAHRLIALLENLTLALAEDLSAGKLGSDLAIDGAMVRKSLA